MSRPSSGWAIRLSLAGATVFGAIAPALADRPVTLSFSESQGYGRITAKWADGDETAPRIIATVAGNNQVLVLSFDQKVTVNVDAMMQGLPSWAAVTRMDADGMTARIGLKQASRLHLSTSVDLAAIDLLPRDARTDPPDIVSPLAAIRAMEAEAKRLADTPPPPKTDELEIRGSHAGDSSRIAFYWPERVSYKVVQQGEGVLKLLFARRGKADLAYLRVTPPANLASFDAENTDKGYLVSVTSKDNFPIRHFYDGDAAVIDITRPAPPEASAPRPEAKPPPPRIEQVTARATEEKPILLALPKTLIQSDGEAAPEVSDKAAAEAGVAVTLGGPERVTELSSNWVDPAPRSGVVDVKVVPLANGLELEAIFAAPAAAAVFSRGSAVWAVFAANADLKVDQAALPAGYRVRTMRSKNAAMMRIEAPKGLTVSAEAAESNWTVRFAPTALKPHRFLKPERKAGRIEAMLVSAAGLIWFEDPVIGDMVAAAVSYGPSSASPTPRDFIEASMPATAHGLAIAPKADEVAISIERERVVVSMPAGGHAGGEGLSPVVEKKIEPPKIIVNPAFVDFARWGPTRSGDFFQRQARLIARAAEADVATTEGAETLLELARFYLGHGMDLEALGVLKVAASERRELETDPVFLGLRGAANYMARRLDAADDNLSRGPLRGDPSASLWRAMVAADRTEWERAVELFRESGDQIHAYPPQKAAVFSAAWGEAALNTNDFDGARRHAEFAAGNGDRETVERSQLVLASLKAVIDGPGAAYPEFERLSNEASEPIAVRAELRRLEAGIASGRMMPNDAAGELESLRFRWRGDDVEMATVGILADQYMRVGRFREALLLTQSTALRDVDAPGTRDLRIKLSDYFRRLFLNGEADRLDPIQALALFYEFADDLTPIGTDGDQMIRKLAQRLVAFDLLEPAGQLLQYQVDNRVRGVGKAAIAVDLATIYLWDKRPDRALAAINATRQPSLPQELALERRLLEAAAYRDLARYDHVVELVDGLEGVEAKSLLAEAYWRDRKYPEAARAFIAMLPQPGAVQARDADIALKAAIAARMAREPALLADLRRYSGAFEGSPDKASFDLITSQADAGAASLSEAVRRLADAPRVDAFAAAMKQRFEAPKAAPAKTAAAAAPAPGGSP